MVFYKPLINKIARMVSRWAANSLLFYGHLKLVQLVLKGIECFWLSMFPTPIAVIKKINRLA
jgi:hypothetical protein